MDLGAHMKKVKENNTKKTKNFISNGSIWYNWKSGDQIVRFLGDFFSTKIHYIGTNSQNTSLNLFPDDAFSGDDKIPKVINCANWNSQAEERVDDGGCVICKLNSISRSMCRSDDFSNMEQKDQEKYKNLRLRTDDRSSFKWNIIDREDNENKGFKIATLGQELFDSLLTIHEDYSPSIFTDDNEGIDIKITRSGGNNERVKYSARMVMEKNQLKITPLTEEEKSWQMHNLIEMCGKRVDQDLVRVKLLDEWQDILNSFDDDGQMEETKTNDDDIDGNQDSGEVDGNQDSDDAPF